MLTMKHVMGGREFAQEINCYTAIMENGKVFFTAYKGDEFGPSAGQWGGHEFAPPEAPAWHSATIYVMNSTGSTVAKYRYFFPESSLVETEIEGSVPPPEDMMEAA